MTNHNRHRIKASAVQGGVENEKPAFPNQGKRWSDEALWRLKVRSHEMGIGALMEQLERKMLELSKETGRSPSSLQAKIAEQGAATPEEIEAARTKIEEAEKFKADRERDQRRMVKDLRITEQNERIVGVDDKDPETWGKAPRQAPAIVDPLKRMHDAGEIDDAALRSAHQIEQAHRIIIRGGRLRTGDMEPRVDNAGGDDATDYEMDVLRIYYAWTAAMHKNGDSADPILDICVDGQTLSATARRYQMHHKTISKLLKDALRLYWEVKKQLGRENVIGQAGPRELASPAK